MDTTSFDRAQRAYDHQLPAWVDAPDPAPRVSSCDICEERVPYDELVPYDAGTCCVDCSLLSVEEQTAIVKGFVQRRIADARAQGRVSLFESLAPHTYNVVRIEEVKS